MPERRLYRCYIDEAGDEGFKFEKGSTPWFFVGGTIVEDEHDAQVREVVDEIRKTLWTDKGQAPPAVLHWRKLSHSKKLYVVDQLRDRPFCQIAVGVWKPKLDRASFICNSDNLFRYVCRLLLERVSWYVDDHMGRVLITFSNRTRFKLELLQSYITIILDSDTGQIRRVFDPHQIKVRNPAQVKMLQLADSCISSVGNAFNPDALGYTHDYYLLGLKERFYRHNGRLLTYGLKLFPDKPFRREYQEQYPFVDKL